VEVNSFALLNLFHFFPPISSTATCFGHHNDFLNVVIQLSPHFPFHHHVTRLSTHYPNCSWLTVLYMTWLSDANHLPRTSMPDPYLTPMTQTRFPCLLINTSAFRHFPDPRPPATYLTSVYLPCIILGPLPIPLAP
jgi:hypothetical protein